MLRRNSNLKRQDFAGLALGPDGLYITHIRMRKTEGIIPSPILKVVEADRVVVQKLAVTGERLLQDRGCRGCHVVGGVGSSIGPSLDVVASGQSNASKYRRIGTCGHCTGIHPWLWCPQTFF